LILADAGEWWSKGAFICGVEIEALISAVVFERKCLVTPADKGILYSQWGTSVFNSFAQLFWEIFGLGKKQGLTPAFPAFDCDPSFRLGTSVFNNFTLLWKIFDVILILPFVDALQFAHSIVAKYDNERPDPGA
jgi:hypothetical protein